MSTLSKMINYYDDLPEDEKKNAFKSFGVKKVIRPFCTTELCGAFGVGKTLKTSEVKK